MAVKGGWQTNHTAYAQRPAVPFLDEAGLQRGRERNPRPARPLYGVANGAVVVTLIGPVRPWRLQVEHVQGVIDAPDKPGVPKKHAVGVIPVANVQRRAF